MKRCVHDCSFVCTMPKKKKVKEVDVAAVALPGEVQIGHTALVMTDKNEESMVGDVCAEVAERSSETKAGKVPSCDKANARFSYGCNFSF